MNIVVAIPFNTDASEDFWSTLKSAIWLYQDMRMCVVIAPNGPNAGGMFHALCRHGIDPDSVYLAGGRSGPNPYPARNAAANVAFDLLGADWILFTDGDCYPDGNYDEILRRHLAKLDLEQPHIIAGRVETEIPDKQSFHFQTLRAVGFECYGDHLDPKLPVGANMLVNKKSWDLVGPFKETRSGGDGIIGMDLERLGHQVTIAQDLIVTKVVFGMTLMGILTKQLTNGFCFPDYDQPDLADSLHSLQMACAGIAGLDPARQYPQLVDLLFQVALHLGKASYRADAEI